MSQKVLPKSVRQKSVQKEEKRGSGFSRDSVGKEGKNRSFRTAFALTPRTKIENGHP
jgi:hypothetical protein